MRRLAVSLALLAFIAVPTGTAGAIAGHARSLVHFRDRAAGLSVTYPVGWHRLDKLTTIIYPRERLALASYPLEAGDEAGECEPVRNLHRMPPGGAFIHLWEYRGDKGSPWQGLRRRDFPLRPSRFHVRRADLRRGIGCYAGPAQVLRFRAADRPFQLFVAFGRRASDARLRQVEAALNSFAFAQLRPLPPDPYAGWKLLTTESGDSFRPPPGWPASATLMPRILPRPRSLFFASNLPLAGLPGKFSRSVPQLPGPFPSDALDAFPQGAALVWVLEEQLGGPSPEFPDLSRSWRAGDFRVTTSGPAAQWPTLSWLRAGISFRGYRFSVWVVLGPRASDGDRMLALKSAVTTALSGCLREPVNDCPEG